MKIVEGMMFEILRPEGPVRLTILSKGQEFDDGALYDVELDMNGDIRRQMVFSGTVVKNEKTVFDRMQYLEESDHNLLTPQRVMNR